MRAPPDSPQREALARAESGEGNSKNLDRGLDSLENNDFPENFKPRHIGMIVDRVLVDAGLAAISRLTRQAIEAEAREADEALRQARIIQGKLEEFGLWTGPATVTVDLPERRVA